MFNSLKKFAVTSFENYIRSIVSSEENTINVTGSNNEVFSAMIEHSLPEETLNQLRYLKSVYGCSHDIIALISAINIASQIASITNNGAELKIVCPGMPDRPIELRVNGAGVEKIIDILKQKGFIL